MSIVQHRPLTKVLNKYFDRIPAPSTFLINFVFVMHRKSSWIIPPFFIWYPAGYRILLPYSQPNTGYQKRPDISFLTLVRKSFTIGNENTQFFITKDKKSRPQNFRNECKKIICNFFDKFFFCEFKNPDIWYGTGTGMWHTRIFRFRFPDSLDIRYIVTYEYRWSVRENL